MKLVGRGNFSECWLLPGGKEVLLVGKDPAKEAATSHREKRERAGQKPALWIPPTRKVGKDRYTQPYYKPLGGERAEKYHASLVEASRAYPSTDYINLAVGASLLPSRAKEELLELIQHTKLKTGLFVSLDTRRENFSTDNTGRIIFRDCLVCW